jgi:hypothetical protein
MPFTAWKQFFCGENSIMRLDDWLAVFGDKEADDDQDADGCSPCDPNECTGYPGICVDCTKCTHHCICDQADAVKTDPPSQLTPNSSSSDNQNQIEFTASDES